MPDKKNEIKRTLELSGDNAERYKVADNEQVRTQLTQAWSALRDGNVAEAARLAQGMELTIEQAISQRGKD